MKKWSERIALAAGIALAGLLAVLAGQMLAALANGSPPAKAKIEWERASNVERTRTPGGWIVKSGGGAYVYVPDPKGEWLAEPVESLRCQD